MKKEDIIKVLTSLAGSIEQEQLALYEKLLGERSFNNKIEDVDQFYFRLIYPHDNFISGLIKKEISKNDDVIFLFKNSRFIRSNFLYWIKKFEGAPCSVDKTGTILSRLMGFYKNGTKIIFEYKAEYNYHLPKRIFTTHDSIIAFYEGVRNLFYGNPTLYLNVIKTLIADNGKIVVE
jgi:hypothetical protein